MHTCDRCGPQVAAEHAWTSPDGTTVLRFCNHHHRQYALQLVAQGFTLRVPVVASR